MAQTIETRASAHCGVMAPPPGVTPNCTNPTTQTASNIALHTIMIVLAIASLSVRLYTRRFILHSTGLDDYLCILGFGLLISYSAMLLACGKMYLGHHVWDIPKGDYIYGHKLEVISEWIYCFIAPTLKLAALWFYRRIFGPQSRVNYLLNGAIIFVIIAYTALFFISLLTCMPFERRFNPFVQGNCLPSGVSAYLSGAINVLTDAFVVLFPIPIIGKLNMRLSQKIRALAVFGLGIIVLALSITRLAKTPLVFKETDPTWELSSFAIYSILELYIGLMCTCFLASPSFLDRFGPRFVSRIRSYTSSLGLTSSNKTSNAHSDTMSEGKRSNGSRETKTSGEDFPSEVEHRSVSERDESLEQKDSTTSLRPYNASDQV